MNSYNPMTGLKKFTAVCIAVLIAGNMQIANAQASINKLNFAGVAEYAAPNFVNGISFTPDGILKNTESGGTKSVNAEAAPVVTRAAEVENTSLIEKLSGIQFKYAMMLNVDVESLKNMSLFGFIENWIGTRYHFGGTTRRGIDCSALTGGLLLAVYGFAMPRTAKQQYQETEHIKKEELTEGDLVFFNTRGGVSHVGIYLENGYFVHASYSQGVTISSLEEKYFAKRFICGGRVEKP
jgi:NlpC/P60 family